MLKEISVKTLLTLMAYGCPPTNLDLKEVLKLGVTHEKAIEMAVSSLSMTFLE